MHLTENAAETQSLKSIAQINSIVYNASLKNDQTDKLYYGSCKTSFNLRYNNHNQSFKGGRKINSPELLKAVWKLKQSGKSPEIRWKIVQHATPYQWFKNMQLMLIRKIANISS